MLKQQHQLFVGLLAAVDAVVVVGACFAAWRFRYAVMPHDWWPQSWEQYPKEALALYMVPVMLLALRWFGLYRPRRDRSVFSELLEIAKCCVAGVLVVVSLAVAFESNLLFSARDAHSWKPITLAGVTLDAGRVQLGALMVILPIMLGLERLCFRWGLRQLRRRGWNLRHVCIIGCGRLGQIVARTLERNTWTGLKVSYFISHQDKTRRETCGGCEVKGGLADLETILDEHKPDAVYIALPGSRSAMMYEVLGRLERFPLDVRVIPDINPRYVPQSMTVSELDGMPILSYRECPTSGLGGVSKRALDICGSLAAMLIFALPMAVVALLVRLSGPGPVVFRQRRVSLGGQVFDIYKFRTMYHAEDEAAPTAGMSRAATWTERNDPRITPIGRWLRRTSLDELPQLLNVLMGEMSLVGPRPERPELIERFRDDWRGYMLRQHVKAGMTGWAQVNGLRGQSSLRKRLQYDLFYVKNWSLGFDVKILILTVFRGFVHKNAH
ncbi:MAG: undecaprenyl-phosphate glucose phosphotransferase [Phycisphaerales bacterium]|nr:undecaprenyl-phosphate glucose phosphotransferase [Phycisphaerales bacterium]